MGKNYTALGLMSGTSMDGIDASVITSDGDKEYSIIADKYYKYEDKFRDELARIRSKILTNEGYINGYEISNDDLNKRRLKIMLKYDENGVPLIGTIRRVSKPSKRIYANNEKCLAVQIRTNSSGEVCLWKRNRQTR